MRFTVLTLFPEVVTRYFTEGVVGRAVQKGLIGVEAVDIRDFTTDRHRSVDDVPFGGGAGMVLKPEPVAQAIESVGEVSLRVMVSPSGRPFRQADAERWAAMDSVLLICGRYEGVDDRIRQDYVDEVVSIGDYVLTGGELAALVVADATLRLVPGVLGNRESARHESFSEGLLEHPHFTRPAMWRGRGVPAVLTSGHHGKIAEWRREMSLRRTALIRPDLLEGAALSPRDKALLATLAEGEATEES
jgi:tRNA (guanine37-N1)-methyltransferase